MATLTTLPIEILYGILQHLSTAKDLLSLCASSRVFQEARELRYDPSFWSRLTNETFRVPNRPVVAGDGKRWQHLYRRLSRESRVYCWGNNDRGSLGTHVHPTPNTFRARARAPRPSRTSFSRDSQQNASWPQELPLPDDIGIVADLQCGGWSTAALNAEGRIHVTGQLRDALGMGGWTSHMCELMLPFGYDTDRVRQFSLGRSHLLAVGDQGTVYNWDDIELRGSPVKFASLDEPNVVTKVLAGWGHSSCFILGKGIIIWQPIPSRLQNGSDLPAEPTKVFDVFIVPHTESSNSPERRSRVQEPKKYGKVTNWILLRDFVIWVDNRGRAYATPTPNDERNVLSDGVDITPKETVGGRPYEVLDIQGSHAHFALIMCNGEVFTSDQHLLEEFWRFSHSRSTQGNQDVEVEGGNLVYRRIPALQNSEVIQIAFGDWHFHALHSDGTISSYGKEPNFCGALGLGGFGSDAVRGIKALGFGGDGELLSHCQTTGRRVWFEPEKQTWINHVRTGGNNKREAEERMNMMYEDDTIRAEVSEWFEHRLRQWEQVLPAEEIIEDPDDDGLPAYFALSVAAAGWHSGALVLQNEKKRTRVRELYNRKLASSRNKGQFSQNVINTQEEPSPADQIKSTLLNAGRWFLGLQDAENTEQLEEWTWNDETFPRLRLKDGRILPGNVEMEEWTCPEWKEVDRILVSLADTSSAPADGG